MEYQNGRKSLLFGALRVSDAQIDNTKYLLQSPNVSSVPLPVAGTARPQTDRKEGVAFRNVTANTTTQK
jgi:hypothetical protein